jgi:hypothetical protein
MPAVDTQHVLEMSATEDENPIETVGADCPNPAFGVGVRIRGLDRRPNHLDALTEWKTSLNAWLNFSSLPSAPVA